MPISEKDVNKIIINSAPLWYSTLQLLIVYGTSVFCFVFWRMQKSRSLLFLFFISPLETRSWTRTAGWFWKRAKNAYAGVSATTSRKSKSFPTLSGSDVSVQLISHFPAPSKAHVSSLPSPVAVVSCSYNIRFNHSIANAYCSMGLKTKTVQIMPKVYS